LKTQNEIINFSNETFQTSSIYFEIRTSSSIFTLSRASMSLFAILICFQFHHSCTVSKVKAITKRESDKLGPSGKTFHNNNKKASCDIKSTLRKITKLFRILLPCKKYQPLPFSLSSSLSNITRVYPDFRKYCAKN